MTAISSMEVIAILAVNVISCHNNIRVPYIPTSLIFNKYQFKLNRILILHYIILCLRFNFKFTAT